MSEPRKLGEIMKEYLLNSDDDFATAFRELYREHGGKFLEDKLKKSLVDEEIMYLMIHINRMCSRENK